MRRRNSFLKVAAGALAVLPLAAACGSSPEVGGAPTSLATTVLPLPSAAPSSAVPGTVQDPQLVAALDAAARRYWEVQTAVYVDPRKNMPLVDTAATGDWATNLRNQGQQIIDKNLTVTGTETVVSTSIASVVPSPVVDGQVATATVKTCVDYSTFTLTRPDGSSGVDPKRLPQNQSTLTLTNSTPQDPAAWRVSGVSQGPTIPCDSAS